MCGLVIQQINECLGINFPFNIVSRDGSNEIHNNNFIVIICHTHIKQLSNVPRPAMQDTHTRTHTHIHTHSIQSCSIAHAYKYMRVLHIFCAYGFKTPIL